MPCECWGALSGSSAATACRNGFKQLHKDEYALFRDTVADWQHPEVVQFLMG